MSSPENSTPEPTDHPDVEALTIELDREIVLLEHGIPPDRVARIAALNERKKRYWQHMSGGETDE